MYTENFAAKLKQARIENKMTQKQVAEALKTTQSQITKYETNRLEPNIETLAKLIDLYCINANWLLGTGKYLDE